ncbi:hypothetical protein O4H50_06325 [Vibrio diazotrophicus]|uniref:hypothetical protein n=1 Tax=Vibrio diazotrophicus TaxID=685 RepID=UPI0022AE565C|nr:hypothetical protein [Vibrio diazotrophicus]MCZ4371400.1 hypothetical protein [Vibrio diazotrophicus]
MFSIERALVPYFKQQSAESLVRGDVVNIEGHAFWLVEKCEEQGANMVVKCLGIEPLLISKDRVVSVRSYR